jgi:hypothetical protein
MTVNRLDYLIPLTTFAMRPASPTASTPGADLPIRQAGDELMQVADRECWGSLSLLSEPGDEMRADAVGVQSPGDEVSGTHPSPPRPLPE